MIVITTARKPIEGSVSSNVLRFGCGGLNIDVSRIGTDKMGGYTVSMLGKGTWTPDNCGFKKDFVAHEGVGRWPANVVLLENEEVLAEFPMTASGMMQAGQQRKATLGGGGYHGNMPDEATATGTYGDSGSAARFFKQVKG